MVLGSVGREDAGHSRVEAAAEDGRQSCFAEAVAVGPLPRVFEVSLILWLVIGRVQVVASAGQARFHDGQVLVGQCEVNHQLRAIAAEERLQLFHVVGIHLSRPDICLVSLLVDGVYQSVAFLLSAAGNHELSEHVGVLHDFESGHGGHATCANHQYSAHIFLSSIMVV